MEYNTLKNIIYNMPETYEDAIKYNSSTVYVIQQEILLDNLIKHGIFEDREDYFNQCSKKYDEIRNETIKQLEEMGKENEY